MTGSAQSGSSALALRAARDRSRAAGVPPPGARTFRDHRDDLGPEIVPTQAVYVGAKNAVRTLLEALRQESTDGVLRTTSISPGYVRTELADYIDDPDIREQVQRRMATLGIGPDAVARAVAFAIEQPDDVEIGDITIRPTNQN